MRAHAHALYVGAALAESQGDYAQAQQMLETCLALRRGLGDVVDIAATLSTLSMALLPAGDVLGARESELEALQLFRQLGDGVGEVIGLLHLGHIDRYSGDDERARTYLEECLALSRKIKYREAEADCELVLGEIALDEGDVAQARVRFQRSLIVCREAGDTRGESRAVHWLGKADLRDGDLESAGRRLGEALGAFRAFECREDLLSCLEDKAAWAAAEGRTESAVQIAAAADRARERFAIKRQPSNVPQWKAQIGSLRASMTPAAFDEAWATGARWEIDEAIKGTMKESATPVASRRTDELG